MKVYIPIYSSGYARNEFETIVPGIFFSKKDAMKRLIELVVAKRFDLDNYNEQALDSEGDEECAFYLISKNKELDTTEELVDGLVGYVKEDIDRLIEIADDSYYKEGWTIQIDERYVE